MKQQIKDFWTANQGWLAIGAALLGGLVYAWKSWVLAQHTSSLVLDESLYVFKGFLFASGRYQPFQDYGPLTNHMPLSFLIPGYIQTWFGPGIRTARVFAFAMSMTMAAAWGLAAARLGGKWWGAAVVWVFALNATWAQVFSMGFSQVLVNVFLSWAFVLTLGEQRSDWQIGLAAVLAAFAGMTRINVLPLLAFYLVFVFWQHGRRAGWIAAAAGGITLLVIHALYWPGILRMWANWLPAGVFPFLHAYQAPASFELVPEDFSWFPIQAWIGDPSHLVWNALSAFWLGVRLNFVPLVGVFTALVLWPRREKWKSEYQFRLSVFLAASFLFLFIIHMWAALSGKSCQFSCFGGYLLFFDGLGLLLVVNSFSVWRKQLPTWQQILLYVSVALLFLAVLNQQGSHYDGVRKAILDLIDLEVPKIENLRIQPGTVPLWVLLENKFGFNHYPLRRFVFYDKAGFTALMRGLILAGLTLAAIPLGYRWTKRRHLGIDNFGNFVLLFTLGFGTLFASLPLFSKDQTEPVCAENVLTSHEQTAAELRETIPEGSTIFWNVKSSMLLLYLPEVNIFPALLNYGFAYVEADNQADPDELARFGFWNDELGEQWIQEADFIAVENRFYDEDWQARVAAGELEIIFTSSPVETCRGDEARILVLQKSDG